MVVQEMVDMMLVVLSSCFIDLIAEGKISEGLEITSNDFKKRSEKTV
ncbi:hypothetical protein [Chengkuizengella sediminis]|nr:hypothetical protein [Chengkuizengella sediminis]NDI33585.1 hypothetical protein [Chengkuizengella sediminis]